MKNKNKLNSIYEQIALKEGVSIENVEKEIQEAILSAFKNPTKEQKIFQDCIPKKGEIPTPEELIHFLAKNFFH